MAILNQLVPESYIYIRSILQTGLALHTYFFFEHKRDGKMML
jgi:hypothetical protein